jgi:hypothetical protein
MLDRFTLKSTLAVGPNCLTPQELEKFVENSAPADSHLAQCLRCQSELALLKSFESSEPLPDEGAAVAWISKRLESRLSQIKGLEPSKEEITQAGWFTRLFGQGRAGWLIPVAVLTLVVVGVALMHRGQEPELRADNSHPAIYRSQEIETISPGGSLQAAPEILQWKPFAGAAAYKVTIMEVDQTSLWDGQTSDSNVTIPAAVRAKILPGKPVLWRVSALDARGQVLAVSQIQRFSVVLDSSGPALKLN